MEIDRSEGLEESIDTMGLTLLSKHRANQRFKKAPAATFDPIWPRAIHLLNQFVSSCLLQTHYSDTWYALLCVTPLVPTGPLVLTCSINNLAAPILSSHTCSYFISTSCLLFDLWCLSSVCLVCVFLWFCQEKHSLFLSHSPASTQYVYQMWHSGYVGSVDWP